MSTKTLLITSVLFGFLLSVAANQCFAGTSELIEQAQIYKQDGNYEQAEAIYLQIVKDYPGTGDAFESQKNLAMLYVLWCNQPEANTALQQLLAGFYTHKDISQAVHDIAYQYRLLHKYEKANQIDQYVVDNWPQSDYAVLGQMDLAKYYVDRGDDPNAEVACDKLLANFSNNPLIARAVHDVAQHYRDSRKYDKSNQLYQYVIDHWPKTEHALWAEADLIKSYLALGDGPNAEAAIDKLLANFTDNPLTARAVWDTAQLFRDLKKYQKANQLYLHVIDNWPKAEHAMWAEADLIKSYLAIGDGPNAEAAIDKLLTNFTDNPLIARAVWDTAHLYRGLKKYEKANQLYRHVVGNWPESEHAIQSQADLIESNLALGDDTAAQAAVDKLLADFSEHPLIARTVWDTGQVYRDLKKYEKANSLYQHVVENWPESEHAIQSQADLIKSNIALGDDVAAKAAVDKLLADFSEHPLIARTVWGTGQVYRDLKKYEKANQLYQHVINEWPGTEHAMWSQADLIKLYLALGDDPNAEAAADKLLADFNDSPLIARAVWDTGQVYRGLKKYKKANRLYQHVVENWPKPEHAMWAQADLIKSYLALGDDPNAEAAADKLLTDFNDSPLIARAVWDTARLYRDLKKYEKANQLYQHVIGDYPQAEHAILSQMGVAEVNVFSLIDFGNDTAAQEALDILIADFNDQPELPQTLLSISEQYFYRHNYKRATELWELMLSKYPGSSVIDEILYPLATCYERLKDHPNAIKYFTKLVEQYPNGQYAYRAPYKMALIYRRQEQYDQAIFWFQRQRQLYSKEPYGDRALYCEGLIYLNKLKDYRKAADIFQEYIETYPNGERLLAPYRLAVCYEEMGQRAQAIELLQQGLMEYSDTVYAETYMEKLMQLQ